MGKFWSSWIFLKELKILIDEIFFFFFENLQFLIMNKSSYFKKKKEKKKEIFKKDLETRGIGLIFLRPLSKKKNHQSNYFKFLQKFKISKFFKKKKNSKFSIPSKNSSFPNSNNQKKIFIKFFFRNRKLWSSSTFSSDATSSQLSTLSILRSMEYVPN